jgi:enamine deaminase RidA (YjgF/YER057c/UK114 family)
MFDAGASVDGVSAPMCPRSAESPGGGVQPGKNPTHPTHFAPVTGGAARRPKVVPTPRHTAKGTSMRKTFGTGSVWEQQVGYSRAVQVDNTLYISATAASGEDGVVGEDFYTQTRYILDKLDTVLADAGFDYADVVQSKLYLTDISQWEEAGRAHGEVFGEIRPTLALVHVLPFLDPKMLVEIELVAQKSTS